jgi:hypothetical protein
LKVAAFNVTFAFVTCAVSIRVTNVGKLVNKRVWLSHRLIFSQGVHLSQIEQ